LVVERYEHWLEVPLFLALRLTKAVTTNDSVVSIA